MSWKATAITSCWATRRFSPTEPCAARSTTAAASRNILNNPVRAFDFLGSEYTPSLVSEADGRAVVRLTPAAGNDSPAGDVTLTVDTATMRPRSLSYDYDGEQVLVNVLEVAPLAGLVRRFDPKNYEGYEFIDFR